MDVPLNFRVPQSVLNETGATLADIGSEGVEGVVLWVAREAQGLDVEILRALVPAQIAFRSEDGLAVMIPDWSVSELILGLDEGTYIPIRVHSHPQDAYHSSTDDLNRLLSHRGAISIVVPDFARHGMHLPACSVNELGEDFRWRELASDEVARRFRVVE
jgi:hypothetical protein